MAEHGKILIVEDQPELAEVLEYQLQAQGFETLLAGDGLQACRTIGRERPDLILLGDPPEAIEVELSDKSNRRLDEILKGWRWAIAEERFSYVRYLCSPRALPHVERAVERTRVEGRVVVERLEGSMLSKFS